MTKPENDKARRVAAPQMNEGVTLFKKRLYEYIL